MGKSQITKKQVVCKNCNIVFKKTLSKIGKNNFCSQSCSATYNNKHKKYGIRRSKLETWAEEQLIDLYPDLKIRYNRKDAIESELDIYIPSLKLAFELNGIFHYQPIFGEPKLKKIQHNDKCKFQHCIEQGISLCVINTESHRYVTKKTSQKYIDIIIKHIDNNL